LGLFKRLARFGRSSKKTTSDNPIQRVVEKSFRNCRFEQMEDRQMFNADPIYVGGVYIEDDSGTDSQGDTFYVAYQGGSATTNLTRLVIDGNQDGDATKLGSPDVYFDTVANNAAGNIRGAGGAQGFKLDTTKSIGIVASDVKFTVVDGGTRLVLDIKDFKQGDVLVFTIDVDQYFANKPDDQVTSGIEFAGSSFKAFFQDTHYDFSPKSGATGTFNYAFDFGSDDTRNTGMLSMLPTKENRQTEDGNQSVENRTAGVMQKYVLTPKPVSISGTVYHDRNVNCAQDTGEEGIGGVTLRLQKMNASGQYVDIAMNGKTMLTTKTDADGNYSFGTDLGLMPGKYRVVELQPKDFEFSVCADPGSVGGKDSGKAVGTNVIADIEIPFGDMHSVNNDFGEVKGAKIAGYVYHDVNYNGRRDAGDVGIANTTLRLTGTDAFGKTHNVTMKTNADGYYCFEALPPGTYCVVETQPLGFADHLETIGKVGTKTVGELDGNDKFCSITVGSGDVGLHYNFGEVVLGSLSGHVQLTTPDGRCVTADSPEYRGIAGVTVKLQDADGKVWTTTTNSDGFYEFKNLRPGAYTIIETQPTVYLDDGEMVGTINGQHVGANGTNDQFTQIVLASGQNGVNYDFCESEPAEICGVVYHDRNNNGVQDSGEQGIASVVLRLLDANGNVVKQTTTDAEGHYCFTELARGEYCVEEIQPEGYRDGKDTTGTVDGTSVGTKVNDKHCNIVVLNGQSGIEYNFGELKTGSIQGFVHTDRNGNCVLDASQGESPISGVRMELLDESGDVIAWTLTDANGSYRFDNLDIGTYSVRQIQPEAYKSGGEVIGNLEGSDTVGTGKTSQNKISNIQIGSGEHFVKYNFCEVESGSIQGVVHADRDGDCIFDPGTQEMLLSGVLIELLDSDGKVVASMTTGANGAYKFENLLPGTYSIRQTQPTGYLSEGQEVGKDAATGKAGTGSGATTNMFTNVILAGNQDLIEYNFCEVPPAQLSGFVYQDGAVLKLTEGDAIPKPQALDALRNGLKTADDTPLAGVILELRNGVTGQPIMGQDLLGGMYPNGPVRTMTDANGYYHFGGLPPGNYAVFQVQPEDYIDHRDSEGTTDGVAINPQDNVSPLILSTLADGIDPNNDAILRIAIGAGEHSQLNNFSEVKVEFTPPPDNPRTPLDPPVNRSSPPPSIGPRFQPGPGFGMAGHLPVSTHTTISSGMAGSTETEPVGGYAWQLSIVNGGHPRGQEIDGKDGITWQSASYLSTTNWAEVNMSEGAWEITLDNVDALAGKAEKVERFYFGSSNATPIVGDFNGDGRDEVGIFQDGQWFVDLTGDFHWDSDDMWANLGEKGDQALVGDWDGDGKDDIGVFGPRHQLVEQDWEREPGIPDPQNLTDSDPKNIPPNSQQRPHAQRDLRRSDRGSARTDVVDHVFRFGDEGDIAVVGDWNGDGIHTGGLFRDGIWRLDVDGDGKISGDDMIVNYGEKGDRPVVGDFNDDGIDEIGVFRNGSWIVDINRDQELDAQDKVFELGGAESIPVVGDFDGDGVDEPGVYQTRTNPKTASRL
jgi:serine-aspartate repeat-containing protein C/D/E